MEGAGKHGDALHARHLPLFTQDAVRVFFNQQTGVMPDVFDATLYLQPWIPPGSESSPEDFVEAAPEPEPELISTQPLMDRLAVLAELINNPEKLIKRAARAFADKGIRTNVTLCFSAAQAMLAAKAGATFISPFIGRLDDINLDGSCTGTESLPKRDIPQVVIVRMKFEILLGKKQNRA